MSATIGTESLVSNLSWNTRISRTRLSTVDGLSLGAAPVLTAQGPDQLLRTIQQIGLSHYSIEELQHEAVVGEGESFRVERCVYNKAVVAVKHVKLGHSQANVQSSYHRLQSVLLEIQIMRHSPLKDHPNILSALGYGWKSHGERLLPYVVVEYAVHGCMRAWLRGTARELKTKFKLAGDIASGLEALHVCDIIHGDLKLDNILVVPAPAREVQVVAKLCNFGHSIILRNGTRDFKYFGTILYNAPEVELQETFKIEPENLHKCDIWAYGLSIWELFADGTRYFHSSWANDPRYTSQALDPPTYSQVGLAAASPHIGTASIHTENSYFMVSPNDSRNIPFSDRIAESELGTFSHKHLQPLSREFVDTLWFPGLTIEKGYLRKLLHNTLQFDPSLRPSQIKLVPTLMDWDHSDQGALQEQLALHTGSSALTFEIFGFDQESEVPWEYKRKILQNLASLAEHHGTQDQAATAASMSFQASFCYMIGFGTSPNIPAGLQFLEKAIQLAHPMALLFGKSLQQAPNSNNVAEMPLNPPGNVYESYTKNIIVGFRAKRLDIKEVELNDNDGVLLVGPEKFKNYAALKVFLQALNETQREKAINTYVIAMPYSIRMDLLSLAIAMDDAVTVQGFAKIFIHGKVTNPLDETALIQACRRGIVEMVLALLDAGADPLKMTKDGCSLYHWLFMLGDGVSSVVDKLLELESTGKNELLDQPCSRTYVLHQQWPLRLVGTPLAFAIECGSIPAVKALLKLGASPHAPAFSHTETPSTIEWTPIHLAFKFHQTEILRLLLNTDSPFLFMNHRPAVNVIELARSICYSTPIERMAMHGASRRKTALYEILRMLDFGVLSTPTKDGQTPFMQAIDFSNIDVVKAMTEAEPTLYEKPFVDPEDEKVFTYPAIFAAQIAAKRDSSDAFEIVKLLLKGGPQSMKLRDSQGRTPLHFSVTGTSTLATKWLITFGYGMGDLDNSGRTPIHNCRTTESLDILLDLDPNINQTDNSGLAPIHVAALQGFEDMVEGLIFRNADLTVAGAIGSALHCAVLAQSRRVMSLLLKANDGRGNKLDINAVDSNGDTALHLAARVLRPDLLHLLFSYRIKKSVRNKAGLTAKSQLEIYHKKMLHEVVTMVDGQRVYPYPPDGEANAGKSVETSNDKSYNKEEAPWRNLFSKFRRSTATEPKSQSESDESDSEWPYSGNKRTIEEALQSMQTENEDESELLRSFKDAELQYTKDMLKLSKWNSNTLPPNMN